MEKPEPEFSLQENPNNVIDFLYILKSYAKKFFRGHQLTIDLGAVVRIDIGAICLLLSVVEELSYFNLNIIGTIPVHKDCKNIFIESGFLSHMRTISGKSFTETSSKNLIVKRGKDKTKNRVVGETIKAAMEILTNKKIHYPPIFSIVQEINGNSVEHAYQSKHEHWLFSINHDILRNRVVFTFADNGSGILGTLHRKLTQQFFDGLQLKNNEAILKGAFTKNYASRHEAQINRNKGLPLLKKIVSNGEVKNLFVIANNVLLHIDSYTSMSLNKNFSGTFYYWELDNECINTWQKKSHTTS